MNRAKLVAAALAAAIGSIVLAAPAIAKDARCEIRTADSARYSGSCRLTADKGGSFSVSPIGKSAFFGHTRDEPGITAISVHVTGGDAADVRGLTTNGNNSRWGAATRSASDRACWTGQDFSVCVY